VCCVLRGVGVGGVCARAHLAPLALGGARVCRVFGQTAPAQSYRNAKTKDGTKYILTHCTLRFDEIFKQGSKVQGAIVLITPKTP
jgi:hypothetical protein